MLRSLKISTKISSVIILIVLVSIVSIIIISYSTFTHLSKHLNVTTTNYIDSLKIYFLLDVIIILLATIASSIALSNYITKPIKSIKEYLMLMEQGILPNEIPQYTKDEIGEMAILLNKLVQSLRHTANFAHDIGEGNLNAQFKPLSENDILGNSLINMQKSLKEADQKEKERNWIVNGIAELGDILRKHNNIELLSYETVASMVFKINGIQGAFYKVEVDEETGDKRIVMKSCYAYNRKKYINQSFKFGEGLVGQAAIEADTIYRTEIPNDYCTITSGLLGDRKPKALLIVPMITEEEVYGVIEFASLNLLSKNEIKFVEEAAPIIARTVSNIDVNERTQKHLEQSQKMSSELQQQQEELRQNAEEMRATQEDLQQANHSLEDKIEEVNRTQKRMHSLLENASEVITIYENDGRVRYVSPSVSHILGIQAEELVGTKDEIKIHDEDREEFKGMFKNLLAQPDNTFTIQFRYKKKSGEWMWLEATGKNLLNDTAVKGIVLNSRDITLKRKAEIEERMRKNMQALSENSPDLITRISCEGVIAYTNPTIESYTGCKPEDFLNNQLDNITIGNGIVGSWKAILQEVKLNKTKLNKEFKYSSPKGERIMQVNAIPEYNQSEIESVLVVSHDITERKLIELEIAAKNKNINESINYSKRIQNAIIPDTRTIRKKFPKSFILYKPRDVVSGDFPWYVEKDDNVFIAAVDCTGHGVPGAMLSLVGYFQLNNIVDSHSNLSSGEILDELDEKVNSTLIKDTNDENIKDGMDIAFCKIDPLNNIVEYAGAHRPLYHLTNNEIIEYKGDKWAIGGGVYKNQTKFTNYKIKVKSGESIFFFSDGFPDQFGGKDNRKFGQARIKDIILKNKEKSMEEMNEILKNEFESWKENHKQTDDVLLIGIKF